MKTVIALMAASDCRIFNGWWFANPLMTPLYGTDPMPETAEKLAGDYGISRADQTCQSSAWAAFLSSLACLIPL